MTIIFTTTAELRCDLGTDDDADDEDKDDEEQDDEDHFCTSDLQFTRCTKAAFASRTTDDSEDTVQVIVMIYSFELQSKC